MRTKLTTKEFISRARQVHGNKFDYTKTVYTGALNKIVVTCRIHGDFTQRADFHLRSYGCPTCGHMSTSAHFGFTTENFVTKANKLHNGKYDYTKTKYVNDKTKVEIACYLHGDFTQSPISHLNGRGCKACGHTTLTTKEVISRSNKIHKHRYKYTKTEYARPEDKITITCSSHGDFRQMASSHMSGQGCPKCALVSNKVVKLTTEEFINRAMKVHGNRYSYKKTEYSGWLNRIVIACQKHGDFHIVATRHLSGFGCPTCAIRCVPRAFSKIAIKWIEEYSACLRLQNVQHAANNGEFVIPGTRYRVDGFHAKSKTVFEFLGDRWHGNLNTYKPMDRCHLFSDKTAKQLNRETMLRLHEIQDLGYKVIYIWESDYHIGKKPYVLNPLPIGLP